MDRNELSCCKQASPAVRREDWTTSPCLSLSGTCGLAHLYPLLLYINFISSKANTFSPCPFPHTVQLFFFQCHPGPLLSCSSHSYRGERMGKGGSDQSDSSPCLFPPSLPILSAFWNVTSGTENMSACWITRHHFVSVTQLWQGCHSSKCVTSVL